MSFFLNTASMNKLKGVHPDLIKVVVRAIKLSKVDFKILEGTRTIERQKQLVAAGASQTMNSRHIPKNGVGHAVDLGALLDGKVRWDWPLYHKIADAMKKAAKELKIPIEWGGDWPRFKDGPHWQLPWKQYP